MSYELRPIGRVHSELRRRADAPKQGAEGAPEARLEIFRQFLPCLDGIAPGMDVIVLTWLHEARRDVMKVHPRDDTTRAEAGVFATRSPDRPNPIGLHRVRVVANDGEGWLTVRPLEAIDATPVVDIKRALDATTDA